MGKRVYVKHLMMGVGVGAGGEPILKPHEQYAHLSCGHHGGRVSIFSCMGEPAWCKECKSNCLACGRPATTCKKESFEWGEACGRCVKLSEPVWRERVREHRINSMTVDQHVEQAAHFFRVAKQYEREAADKKHKFWDYDRNDPLWLSHTRSGHGQSAKDLFARGVMHTLFVLLGPSKAHAERIGRDKSLRRVK